MEAAFYTSTGTITFSDLLLRGLPYPDTVLQPRDLLAGWVHAVRPERCVRAAGLRMGACACACGGCCADQGTT